MRGILRHGESRGWMHSQFKAIGVGNLCKSKSHAMTNECLKRICNMIRCQNLKMGMPHLTWDEEALARLGKGTNYKKESNG